MLQCAVPAVPHRPHCPSPSKKPSKLAKDSVEHNPSHVPSSTGPLASLRNRLPKESIRSVTNGAHRSPSLSVATNLSPSTSTSPEPTSAKLLPRSPYISSRQISSPVSPSSALPHSPNGPFYRPSSPASTSSSTLDNVLSQGDIVGDGCLLQNERIRLVSIADAPDGYEQPALEFEVITQLGSGSYAVVYEVVEVLSRPPASDEGHMSLMDSMELDGGRSCWEYGRHYAIKCLSKANLDDDALAAQMSEVTIHQSLRPHPNIVTLHSTLETSSFLLLLLEFVPGEDLFYFLEQSRDHYDSDSPTDSPNSDSLTPPTPSLLATMHPSELLSQSRLRLIASMFSQMCDAVAACHAQQVFHRDIKPENFIVTDGWTTLPDGRRERKVVVKLTDFGLSTRDVESSDMDCGSAPYMSYECRNNFAPAYRPRAADVWSLGIVLINMLYHYNPWTDTHRGACPSFDLFCQQPVNFFMQRFAGMARPVAELLANRVFCLLDDPTDDSARLSASEFGAWAKDLPTLLGDSPKRVHKRVVSTSSSVGHSISSSVPASRRPSSRNVSRCGTPAIRSSSLSRAPSLGPAYERDSDLSTVLDHDVEEQEALIEEDEREVYLGREADTDLYLDLEDDGMSSRSPSTHKRRKRGARKGKNSFVPPQSPDLQNDEMPVTLAVQSLAREISRASRTSSLKTSTSASAFSWRDESVAGFPTHPVPPVPPLPAVAKKPSKWKLGFGKNSSIDKVGHPSPTEEPPPLPSPAPEAKDLPTMSPTVSNVTNLIRGLNPQQSQHKPDADSRTRGRRPRPDQVQPSEQPPASSSNISVENWQHNVDLRNASPVSVRSGRQQPGSSASSTHSSNWRSSMSTTSSAMTSTSAFTRYSNSSMRSVSTAATSVSSSSWRTSSKPAPSSPPADPPPQQAQTPIPKNVKILSGVPWELDELPRQLHPNPVGDIFGSPPLRKHRSRKPKDNKLDTINERPGSQKSPLSQDASRSVMDLEDVDGDGPKKVQKGQINALAKMLSALRR